MPLPPMPPLPAALTAASNLTAVQMTNSTLVAATVAQLATLYNTSDASNNGTAAAAASALPSSVKSDVLAVLVTAVPVLVTSQPVQVNNAIAVTTAFVVNNTNLSAADVVNAVSIYSSSVAAPSATVTPQLAQTFVTGLSAVLAAASSSNSTSNGTAPQTNGTSTPPSQAVLAQAGAAVAGLSNNLVTSLSSSYASNATGGVNVNAGGISLSVSWQTATPAAGGGAASFAGVAATALNSPDAGDGGGGARVVSIPPSALPPAQGNGTSVLVTQMTTLDFDPHGGGCDTVVSLSMQLLETGGPGTGSRPVATPVNVTDLAQPIVLQLPSPPAAPSSGVLVRFWDQAAGNYSTVGLVTLPNPIPPGAILQLRSNYTASSDADLPLAWELVMPGCKEAVLNCSDAWERTLAVSADPVHALGANVTRCGDSPPSGAGSATLVRTLVGGSCSAVGTQWNSSVGCRWNQTAQAFMGPTCVWTNRTTVVTRHLTSFGVGPAPRIAVASPSDMASLSPSDLARLWPLITTLAAMFCSMHLLALLLNVRDQADLRRAKAQAFSPELGCTQHGLGLVTWRFEQEPVIQPVDVVRGSAVEFAALVGLPFARLRFALPSTHFAQTAVHHSMGLAGGIAPSALKKHNQALLGALTRGLGAPPGTTARMSAASSRGISSPRSDTPRGSSLFALAWDHGGVSDDGQQGIAPRSSRLLRLARGLTGGGGDSARGHRLFRMAWSLGARDEDDDGPGTDGDKVQGDTPRGRGVSLAEYGTSMMLLPDLKPDFLQMSSTALMHALLQSYCLLSSAEVAQLQTHYVAHLAPAGLDTPDGKRFLGLFALYKELLMGWLNVGSNWMRTAVVFRAVALYSGTGHWEPSDELAFVLQASSHVPEKVARPLALRVRDLLQNLATFVGVHEASGSDTGIVMGAYDIAEAAAEYSDAQWWIRSDVVNPSGSDAAKAADHSAAEEHPDNPLLFEGRAIRDAIPAGLMRSSSSNPGAAHTVWATALTVVFLQEQPISWLTSSPGEAPRTVVDDGTAWLVKVLGKPGAERLMKMARHKLGQWRIVADQRLTAARAAHVRTRVYGVSQVRRVTSSMLLALFNQYTTAAMFLSLYTVGGRRYQNCLLLISGLLAMLMVQLWLWWSKASICCGDLRQLLGCERDYRLPCRGFAGYCSDLNTYAPFALAAASTAAGPQPVPLLVCTAFPMDDSTRDALLSGIISFACAFPVTAVVATLFNLGLATDDAQTRSQVRMLRWRFHLRLLFGRPNWALKPEEPAVETRRTVVQVPLAGTSWGTVTCPKTPSWRVWVLPPRRVVFLGQWWATSWVTKAVVAVTDACCFAAHLGCSLLHLRRRRSSADGDPVPAASVTLPHPPRSSEADVLDLDAAHAFDAKTTAWRRAGFVVLYTVWAVFSWLSITYGGLVYQLMGAGAEQQFLRAWAAGIATGQLSEFQAFATTTLELLLAMTILDALWLLPNIRWLESHSDSLSVLSTQFHRKPGSFAGSFAFLRHGKALSS